MNQFKGWYIQYVEEEDELTGLSKGCCPCCGAEGYHLECQERLSKIYNDNNQYCNFLNEELRPLNYVNLPRDENNQEQNLAEKSLAENLALEISELQYDGGLILENSEMFYFSFCWVGCSGYLISKNDFTVISFGSSVGRDEHLWAYHSGVALADFGEDRKNTIEIYSVRDIGNAKKSLDRVFLQGNKDVSLLESIGSGRIKLDDVDLYFSIRDLLEAKYNDWFQFKIT